MIFKKYLCELNAICLTVAGISLAMLLCSCESPKPPPDEKKNPKQAKKIAFPEEPNKPNNINQAEEVEAPSSDKSKHSALLEKSKIASQGEDKVRKKFYQSFLKKKDQKNAPEKVVMDFKNTDLADLIPLFASVLKFNYTLDPEVKGVVTMSLNTTMTDEEVWNLFEQALNLCGAYCSERDGIVNILPFSKMPQQQQLAMGFKPYGNAETLLYVLQTISPADAAKQIKPFMTVGATAIEMPAQNAILLVDVMGNIPKLYELMRIFDQKPSDRLYRIVLHCNNISASRIVSELTEILPILGFPVSAGQKADAGAAAKVESGVICISGLDRLQLIVATAANEEALDELKKWVETLDSSYGGEQEKVYIYKIINSKATELVQALSAVFKVEGTTMAADSKSTASSSKDSTPEKRNVSSSPVSSSKQKDDKAGPSSVFETPVSIFADAINNRLIIKTTPRTYAMLAALLKSLDTVPDQVLLQVLVAEVTLSDSTSFGIKYSLDENNGDTINWIQTNYSGADPSSKDKSGLSYLLQNSNDSNKNVYLKALAGMTGVKVISSPQLLVTSHSPAKISVGDSVPIITAEITDTQSSADPNNTAVRRSVQYQDTGIILNITPHVTKGKLIEMELEQVVSEAVKTTSSDNIDSPTIQKRELKTSMSLRNGRTLVIGGLIKEKYESSLDSVPGFIDVPFLRRLMSSSKRSVIRTEMLIFITGNIIEESTDLEKTLQRYRDSVEVLKKVQPDLKLPDEQEVGKWFW